VVAFNKYDGKVVYKITDELASYPSPVLTTINGRRWCFVFARGGLIGFEPATGKVDFHFPYRAEDFESVNASTPAVVGDKVFISETYGPGGALLKIAPGSCKELWTDAKKSIKQKSMACHWMTPVYRDGCLYGCSGRHTFNAELRCIDFATGKVKWTVPRLNRTSLLYVDGHFLALEEYGELILFKANPNKFEPISTLRVTNPKTQEELLDYPCWAAPILSHGLLYLRGDDRLVCLELIPEKKMP
jgi:outer membrane protein assembly factor BamB